MVNKENEEMNYARLIDIAKVTEKLFQNNTDNCDITYTHGDFEIVFNFCITKITQNGKVVYNAEED